MSKKKSGPRTTKTDGDDLAAMPGGEPVDFRDPEALGALLLATLKQANRPLGVDEVLRITKLPRKAKKHVDSVLWTLEEAGRCLRVPGGWSAPARLKYVEGVLSVQRAGMGFVTPSTGGQDLYIHPTAMNEAWPGDTVEVLVLPGKRGPSAEGRITKVLRRALEELPVRALRRRKDGLWMCAPVNPRIPALFLTDVGSLSKEVAEDDLLLVTPGEKSDPGLWSATATVNLEREESPAAQERLTKSNHSIPGPFPPAVLAQVQDLPADPAEADFADRRDLRDVAFVTIDGRTARDFDDAIHVEPLANGFRLRVAIADVSHYVRQDTPLDAEARLRGNSCYFPMSVEPMLPEALSNSLCSLNPLVPRLVMVADMSFSPKGHRRSAEMYPAVIRSQARLTYGQIQRGLLLHEAEEEQRLAPLLPMLRDAEKLARELMALRQERGSLDFDLPEAEVSFDGNGEISHMRPRQRHFGHRLIEEFMIAANEAVGSFLEQRGQPTLYRVHQPPDPEKLRSLADFLAQSGLADPLRPSGSARGKSGKPPLPTAADLRRVLSQAKDSPQEYIITRLTLRSMMQAKYQPENEGHFGLASSCYCHFTSPIRRYADLLVHRGLKRALGLPAPAGEKPLSTQRLEDIGTHINETERTAMEAEREIHKRLAVLFLRDRAGEAFYGVISGVTDFGVFVELPTCMAEGMVRLPNLGDDYYEYLPERQELRGKRTRRTFRLGQKLRVVLTDVNLSRLEINLAPADNDDVPVSGRAGIRLRSGITITGRMAAKKNSRPAGDRSGPNPNGKRSVKEKGKRKKRP